MPKILVINDQPDQQGVITKQLSNTIANCMTVVAQSGIEGLQKAQAEQPDVILLDFNLTETNGLEFCNQLKQMNSTKEIPIILITTATDLAQNPLSQRLLVGADMYLTKPIYEPLLAAQVKSALRIKSVKDNLRNEKAKLDNWVKERLQFLLNSNDYIFRILSSSPNPIHVAHNDMSIQYVNTAFEDITGFSSSEIIGKCPPYPWWTEQQKYKNGKEYKDYLEKGKLKTEEVYCNKAGEFFRVEMIAAPVRSANEEDIHFIFHWMDITERRRTEQENIKLLSLLQQSQKMEAIGTLAGGIAHDFNNILGIIMGNTELTRYNLSDEDKAMKYLGEVLIACNRAKDLVKQILTFSRQDEQERKPLMLSVILKEAIKLLRSSLPSTIEIRSHIQTSGDIVLANATQIHQILMNLSTNAAHAMGEKGGVLTFQLEPLDAHSEKLKALPGLEFRNYLKLTISDTGHGMDREVLKRIFDPYFSTKKAGEGTGLGLSVVHGIVTSHEGTIHVESEPGKGTTFEVYLPRVESLQRQQEWVDSTEIPKGNERILFIDDEKALSQIGQRILERLGYQITFRTSSIEALELFQNHPEAFDLVITDQTMPNMTGTELAKSMIQIRPDIPIILCTGFSQYISPEKAKAIGIRDFLSKPLLERDLALAIRRVLDKQ